MHSVKLEDHIQTDQKELSDCEYLNILIYTILNVTAYYVRT